MALVNSTTLISNICSKLDVYACDVFVCHKYLIEFSLNYYIHVTLFLKGRSTEERSMFQTLNEVRRCCGAEEKRRIRAEKETYHDNISANNQQR